MGFFDSVAKGLKNHFDKKAAYQEQIDAAQREVELHKQQVFEEEYRQNAKRVVEAQAKRDAANLSGLQRLRAENRKRHLANPEVKPGTFFDKLGALTEKNKARTQANLERTAALRKAAAEERERRMAERIAQRNANLQKSRTLANRRSTWKP